ncbi:MAG TPA: acyl-CoA dehydrogenase family protein [Myxococcota bacterium]|nr:acyl-CoA dehydrogenase family protein [Myxococcota bacterium]
MNFDLSEEQELLQQTIRQFAQNECPPTRVRELFDAEEELDRALWNGLVELGVGGLHLPEEHGGAGLELLDLALAAEVLGWAAVPGPFLGHSLAGLAIARGGSDAQKKAWLPKLATGDALATVAFRDADGGWLPEDWTAAAAGTLDGAKTAVPYGAQADVIVVGTAGGGLALVERGSGVEAKAMDGADRSRRLHDVAFSGAACEPLPDGAAAAGPVVDAGLLLLAADAFGGASRLVEMCTEYAKTREQFGVTIGHFQALKHQLASMAIEVEPSRGLWWYAAHAADHIAEDRERYAALAKAHLTEIYLQVARDSVEAHGGIGFTWECDVQIWFKRAMFDRAFLGQPSLHRERSAKLSGW